MNIGLVFIVGGLVACVAAFGFNALFVNKSDDENPYRRLVAGIGLAGIIGTGWGALLLFVYDG
jgi:hypothetical protein